jgi:hypothetical protein
MDRQLLPRVDPALLLAELLDESEASVRPAFDKAALDGLRPREPEHPTKSNGPGQPLEDGAAAPV